MPEVYHDKRVEPGSASAKYVYLVKIPEGKQLLAKIFTAMIYTTNPGDYTTAKFIYLGYEQNGVKYFLEGYDVQSGTGLNQGIVLVRNFYVPENGRPFAYFEGTSTSQKYEVMINGILEDVQK